MLIETIGNIKNVPNSINTLRCLAAFEVMWGHMVFHLDIDIPVWGGQMDEIISTILYFFMGVPMFFFLSGYLIWFSVKRTENLKEYCKKRVFRIYPELWIGIIIEIFTIIFFYKEKIQWIRLGFFMLTQGTILQFWTPEFLREYGCGTPNGSLWTICVIIQFYIVIWMIKKFLYRKKGIFWIISTIVLMIVGACTGFVEKIVPDIWYKLYCQTIIQYLWIFWLGIAVSENIEKLLPILKKYWWISIPIYIIWNIFRIDVYSKRYPIFMVTVSCIGCLGGAYALPRLDIKEDISYAMFIYHMIFVNIMIAIGWKGFNGLLVVIGMTILFSYLSTILIGKRSWNKGL